MASQKSRRLRKKLFLDEFAIFGFEFCCNFDISDSNFDELLDSIIEFFESRNLLFGGGGDSKTLSGFVCSNDRYGSATQADQRALEDWLGTIASVSNIEIGSLVDANYGL